MESILLLVVIWFGCGVAAAIAMSAKGRSSCGGFLLGFILGPIGLGIAGRALR